MKRTDWISAAVIVLILLVLCSGALQPVLVLLVGWAHYPIVTVPKMTFEPRAVAVGGVALVLLVALVHGFGRWLYHHRFHGQGRWPAWRLRWTFAVVGIVVLLFGTGISMIVVVHQIGWLATAKEPILGEPSLPPRRFISTNNLKQIALAANNYAEREHRFPPGGTFDRSGTPMHSWETMLLPYMEHPHLPDMDLPWNSPQNALFFKHDLPQFLNPRIDNPRKDRSGFGLSHYAANAHVFGANRAMRAAKITDGLSHTIMAGEVKENFRAWGDPVNWRDPALGVQTSPDGFGGPWSNGITNFSMMDGSVRTISNDVDPAVMKALATPNGGEQIPDSLDP